MIQLYHNNGSCMHGIMHKRKEGSWVLIAPALLCIHAVLFSGFEISMDASLFGHVLLKILSVAVLLG